MEMLRVITEHKIHNSRNKNKNIWLIMWGGNVGYNEDTRKTDWGEWDENATMDVWNDMQWQDQEWKKHGEKIELVWACEEKWRTRTEERAENGYTREKNSQKQDGKTCANETWKILDWERARRWTGRHEVGILSVIQATLCEGKRKRWNSVSLLISLTLFLWTNLAWTQRRPAVTYP